MFASSFLKKVSPKGAAFILRYCATLCHLVSRFWLKTSRHGTCRLQQPPGSWGLPFFIFCGTAKKDEFELEKRTPKQVLVSFLGVYKCHRRHGVQGSAQVLKLQDMMCSLFSMQFFSDTAFRPSVTLHWLRPLIDIAWRPLQLVFTTFGPWCFFDASPTEKKNIQIGACVKVLPVWWFSYMCSCRGKATCESTNRKAQSGFSQLFQNSDEMMSMTPLRVLRAAPRRRRWGDIGGEVGDVWRFAFFVFPGVLETLRCDWQIDHEGGPSVDQHEALSGCRALLCNQGHLRGWMIWYCNRCDFNTFLCITELSVRNFLF